MAYSSSQSESLSFGVETSYKVPTTAAFKVPVVNPSLGPDVSEFNSSALTGNPNPRPNVYGKIKAGGSAEIELSVDSLAPFLRMLTGDAAITPTGVVGSYDHWFPFGAITESWFAEQAHTDITQFLVWKGLYCSGGSINWSAEGLMTGTLNFVGASQQPLAAVTIISGTHTDLTGGLPLEHMAATVKQGTTSLSTTAQSVSLSVSRPTTPIMAMDGTNQLVGYSIGQATIDLTLTTLFSDKVLMDLADAGTETSLTIYSPSSTNGHGLVTMLPTLKLKPSSPKLSGPLNQIAFSSKPYARGAASNVPAKVYSKYIGAAGVAITNSTDDNLSVKIHGAAGIQVDLGTTGTIPLATLASTIDTAITATGTCTVENGRLCLTAKDVTTYTGALSTIQIEAASTADVTLGFDNAIHTGFDASPLLFCLTNATATT